MDKREMIERVLGRFVDLDLVALWQFWEELDIDALAKQAIVIECEVEHEEDEEGVYSHIKHYTENYEFMHGLVEGHHSTPGKAIAIILPLEE